ncbi:MAG: M14 family metallopeptidase [Eubacterium sp.]|nr:M14 family metallopeptidase [Eubacterium sp.]
MIRTIVSAELPADEVLRIRKQRILPGSVTDSKEKKHLLEEKNPKGYKRICVVTGIHGDELEGQYAAFVLQQKIKEEPEALQGIVDIYPAMNPMGIDTITRGMPDFDLDMNRIFPGNENGDMYEHLVHGIVKDVEGASLAVDIHASNIFLTEVPQIRINEITERKLLGYASTMNVDFIWIHSNATVLEATFAYTMNALGVPTLVVEMGVGMRITRSVGEQLADGILATMKAMGMWKGKTNPVRRPVITGDPNGVDFLNAPASGIFVKEADAGTNVKKGDLIGTLINPLTGDVIHHIRAPHDGWLFTIREYPVVQEGSLMGRILKGVHYKPEMRKGGGKNEDL